MQNPFDRFEVLLLPSMAVRSATAALDLGSPVFRAPLQGGHGNGHCGLCPPSPFACRPPVFGVPLTESIHVFCGYSWDATH